MALPSGIGLVLVRVTILLMAGTLASTVVIGASMEEVKTAVRQRDYAAAVQLLTLLSEQGDAEAQYQLASMYRAGQGVETDDKVALHWLTKSAQQGSVKAQYNLGVLYEEGWGTERSLPNAIHWYRQASNAGYTLAARRLASIETERDLASNPSRLAGDKLATRVFQSIEHNDVDMLERLLVWDSAAVVASRDDHGRDVLIAAIEQQRPAIVSSLLNHGVAEPLSDRNDRSHLIAATQTGDPRLVALLLDAKTDAVAIDAVDIRGNSALHYAVQQNADKLVALLLHKGANPNSHDARGFTPLERAIRSNFDQIATTLRRYGGKAEAAPTDTETASQRAARLLKTDPAISGNPEPRLYAGWPALNIASYRGQTANVNALLANTAQVDSRDPTGMTPLLRAAEQGHRDIVSTLLRAGAEKDYRLGDGTTALGLALHNGHDETGVVLLAAGAAMNNEGIDEPYLIAAARLGLQKSALAILKRGSTATALFEHRSALHWAAQQGLVALARQLIISDVPLDRVDAHGQTALHLGVIHGHLQIVQLLHDNGADLARADQLGNSALAYAAANGQLRIARYLIGTGVTAESVNETGSTPLMLAAQQGHSTIVEQLLPHTLDLEQRNNLSYTALMLAAENGHPDVVKILLAAGANPRRKNQNGDNSVLLAEKAGHEELATLLKKGSSGFPFLR